MKPITRQEQLLDSIATGNSVKLEPITREEQYLSAIAGLTDFIPEKPITRKEMFYEKILESRGGDGGTSEGVNLSYTLNDDGTYEPIDAEKDYVFPSGNWYAKFVFVSDKVYTVDELLGCIITTKKLYFGTGSDQPLTIKNVEITSDLITPIADGWTVLDSESQMPIISVITESIAGKDVGFGFALPSNVGTYLIYVDKNPDKRGYVFGSVSVTKTPGKPYIDTSLITDFSYFCYSNARIETIDKLDTSNGTNFTYTFFRCSNLTTAPQLDTSNGRIFVSMFQSCTNLKTVPLLDISNGTSFSAMFQGCTRLTNVALTTAKSDMSSNTFNACSALTDLTIGEGWAVDIHLVSSTNLTVESLHGMIENLADLTGQTAKTFSVGATNLAKIDADHIAMLQAKNWNYS